MPNPLSVGSGYFNKFNCLLGADGTSSWKNGKVDHENSKVKSFPTRQLEHIPELSPVRPQLPVYVQQVSINLF